MTANTFGELFRVTTFGESHGNALGCVIDGCPAGLELSAADIEIELRRRRPGAAYGSRDEEDIPEILSGVFEGKTLGSPIAIVVRNTSQSSSDYEALRNVYRPSHADYTWDAKFGFRDHRGGGRSSGRETLCRVAAGAVAKKILALHGIFVRAWSAAIEGNGLYSDEDFDLEEIEKNHFRVPSKKGAEQAAAIFEKLREEGDSAGGIVSCLVKGVPSGLGEPVFDKLDARLAYAVLSIGACKGIEFGSGFGASQLRGSENNLKADTSSGGILGGISNGQDIFFNAAFKPTPSIAKSQDALDKDGNTVKINIKGRHDVCIVPRAVPVVEAMTALSLVDFIFLAMSDKI
jgi:chorismate synthase